MTYCPVAGLLFLICQFIRTKSGLRPTCFCLLIVFRVYLLAVAWWNWSQGKQFHCNCSFLINNCLCSSGCLLKLLLLFITETPFLLELPLGLRGALNWTYFCVGLCLCVSTGQIQFLHFCACYVMLQSAVVPFMLYVYVGDQSRDFQNWVVGGMNEWQVYV